MATFPTRGLTARDVDALFTRMNEMAEQISALQLKVNEHRHGYRWEAVGKDYKPVQVTTMGHPVLEPEQQTPNSD